MTTKETKGYTKSIMGQMTFAQLNDVLKNPNEPLDKWIIRKTEEAVYGGMDEQGLNRKEEVQNPNPPLITYSVLYWQNIIGIRMSDHITVKAVDQYEAVSKAEQQLTSEGTPFESIGCAYEKTK